MSRAETTKTRAPGRSGRAQLKRSRDHPAAAPTEAPPGTREPRMRVVCCLCHATIREVACSPEQSALISHGYCPACYERVRAELLTAMDDSAAAAKAPPA